LLSTLEFLKYFHEERKYALNSEIIRAAAYGGQIECLKYEGGMGEGEEGDKERGVKSRLKFKYFF
jgi:hypothetical protein